MQSFAEIGPSVLEKIVEGVLPYMDMATILVMAPGLFTKNIGSPFLQMLHIKFRFDWPSEFRGEGL